MGNLVPNFKHNPRLGERQREDLLGDGGLISSLKKALMKGMPRAELREHLGFERGEEAPVPDAPRIGVSRKTLKCGDGAMPRHERRDIRRHL